MQQAHDDGRSEHHAYQWEYVLVPSQLGMYRQNRPPVLVATMAVFVFRLLRRELGTTGGALGGPGAVAPRPVALIADAVVDVLGSELTAAIFALGHGASIPLMVARKPAWGHKTPGRAAGTGIDGCCPPNTGVLQCAMGERPSTRPGPGRVKSGKKKRTPAIPTGLIKLARTGNTEQVW